MKSQHAYFIKERRTPELGTYYVACGQLSAAAAKMKESSLHGSNTMLRFDTESEYQVKLAELKRHGERVQ